MSDIWEYCVFGLGPVANLEGDRLKEHEKQLSLRGAEGWELVHVFLDPIGGREVIAYLRRKKS